MALVWTDEARKSVTPRTATDIAGQRKVPPIAESWAALRNKGVAITKVLVGARRPDGVPALQDLLARAEAWVASETPPSTFDPGVTAAMIAMLEHHNINAVILDAARVTDGLPRALDAFLRSHDLEAVILRQAQRPYLPPTLVSTTHPERSRSEPHLRAALLFADDSTYAACRAVAVAALSHGSLGKRTTIARLFPREVSWGREVATAWLAEPPATLIPTYLLFSNFDDFDLAKKVFERQPRATDLMNIFAWHGEKALPMALATLKKEGAKWDLKPAAAALSLFESEEVAQAFAELLGKAQVRTQAAAYFARYPALARRALTPFLQGKTRVAAFVQEIMAQLDRMDAKAAPNSDPVADASELPMVLVAPPWHVKKKPKRNLVIVPDAKMLPRVETVGPIASTYSPTHLAQFNLPSIEGFVKFVDENWANWYCPPNVILEVLSPRMAMPLVKLADHRSRGSIVWKWIDANLDFTIVGLVPVALSEPGAARNKAEQMLRRLAAKGKKQAIVSVAAEHGGEIEKGILEILSWDAHYDCPKSPPKLPPVCRLDAFTTPRLKNGKLLSPDAVKHIAEMLAFTLEDPPYVGLAEVSEACDPRSLAELAWDMARAWGLAGSKKGSEFMLYALAHFADDEVTRRTTPAIKDRRILEVLRLIGTEAAAIELATIAARATVAPSIYLTDVGGAEGMLEQIARERGITKDELDDRIRPTTALDEKGLILDFGPRTFTIAFDSKLAPVAVDDQKKRSESFPAKRKTDDASKVKLAQAKWNDLREDVLAIGLRRVASLERAMATRRSWDPAAFREVWLESPFILPLAQAVVWVTDGGKSFRVAEDLSFSDDLDHTLTLPAGARIGVAHPVQLGSDAISRWRTLLQEYELIQPFPQLERSGPTSILKDGEHDALEIIRSAPAGMPANTLVYRLKARGFQGEAKGPTWRVLRATATDDTIEVQFAMGSPVGPITIRPLRAGASIACKDANAIDLFEAVRDVEAPA